MLREREKGANFSTVSEMAESQMRCSVPCLPLLLQKVWSNWQITRSPAPLNVFKQTTIIGRCFRLFCPQPPSHRPGCPASQNKDGGWNLAREVPKVH